MYKYGSPVHTMNPELVFAGAVGFFICWWREESIIYYYKYYLKARVLTVIISYVIIL
jgi:hypothetical protein